ncbi:MAG: four helix bundle protein [Opitutaceae bacterium]|nr:four helix bundle protein [Opitutaceae bacterium]
MFNFGKGEVWQKAVTFAGSVYRASRLFPEEERYGLANLDTPTGVFSFLKHRGRCSPASGGLCQIPELRHGLAL